MSYLWTVSDDYPTNMIGEYDNDLSPDRFQFKRATPVNIDKLPVVNFDCSIKALRKYDDLCSNTMVPIISPLMVSTLTKFDVSIQLVDVKVVAKDGIITDYKLLNALVKEQILDKEKSHFSFIPGTKQIMSFSENIYGNLHVPLAREVDYMSHLIIRDDLAKALMQNAAGLGFEFVS